MQVPGFMSSIGISWYDIQDKGGILKVSGACFIGLYVTMLVVGPMFNMNKALGPIPSIS